MVPEKIDDTDFFGRYNRIITATLLLVSIIVGGLFYLQFQANYQYNQRQLITDFNDRVALLNSATKDASDHVKMLQTVAQGYLQSHPVAEPSDSLLLSSLTPTKNPEFYNLSQVPQPLKPDDVGNVFGQGDLTALTVEQKRDLELGFMLNPLFKAVTQDVTNIAWVYYLSTENFISLYPWIAREKPLFSQDYYDYDLYRLARPESNPQREIVWSPPYVDAGGMGLMVTGSAPVYEIDSFHGVVALDYTFNELNQYVQGLKVRGRSQPNVFVMNQSEQLLAHATLVDPQAAIVPSAQMAFPPALRDRLSVFESLPPGQFHTVDDYLLIHQNIERVPWQLVFWLPRWELIKLTLASTNILFLALLPGLGGVLVIANYLTQHEFIRPASLLVTHIEQESQSETAIPQDIPLAWQSWFEQISQNFAQNRLLYEQAQEYARQLETSQLQLVQSEKMSALGNLVAGVAHEINNPTAFIKGNIQPAQEYIQDLLETIDLLVNEYCDDHPDLQAKLDELDLEFIQADLPKLLQSMNLGVERIQAISNSLRIFSRKDQETKTSFNVHDGIDSTLLILKHRTKANESRPAIEIVKDYGKIPDVICFPGQLNQVFMNLLSNALDAFEQANKTKSFAEIERNPNQITVQTACADTTVQITIRDNGCGMTPETANRIFEQGFTTKAVGKGTGLGLAIAHQIITEKHGGTITCTSEQGKGTTFVLTLPLV